METLVVGIIGSAAAGYLIWRAYKTARGESACSSCSSGGCAGCSGCGGHLTAPPKQNK